MKIIARQIPTARAVKHCPPYGDSNPMPEQIFRDERGGYEYRGGTHPFNGGAYRLQLPSWPVVWLVFEGPAEEVPVFYSDSDFEDTFDVIGEEGEEDA